MSWKYEVSVFVTASPQSVWRLFADVSHWSRWDPEAAWSRLDGPVAVGAQGKIKLKTGAELDFELTEVVPDRRLVARTIGSRVSTTTMTHEVRQTAHGVRILLKIVMEGALAKMVGALVGPRLRDACDRAAINLARLAAYHSGVMTDTEPHLMH